MSDFIDQCKLAITFRHLDVLEERRAHLTSATMFCRESIVDARHAYPKLQTFHAAML